MAQDQKREIDAFNSTMLFTTAKDSVPDTRKVMRDVYEALEEKGYDPLSQIVGYILSEDPTYITNHKNARNLIRQVERDELLKTMVKEYLETKL